jgi:hypothetical protein
MMSSTSLANTLLAMGVLIQNLDAHKCAARKDFASKFDDFKQEENRAAFKLLFAPARSRVSQH